MMTILNSDLVILGASIPAVVAAIRARRSGSKVLIVNSYGFPGGPITENLCCRLHKPSIYTDIPVTGEIYDLITCADRSILCEDESYILLNPEVVKYQLQEKLLAEGINLFWHVSPWKAKFEDYRLVELSMLAKEGTVQIRADAWIEAGARLGLLHSLGLGFEPHRDLYYCLFYVSDRHAPSETAEVEQIRLSGRRYWLHIHRRIGAEEEPVVIGHNIIDNLTRRLKGRIELVPAEPLTLLSVKSPHDIKISNVTAIFSEAGSIPVFGGDFLLAAEYERGTL